MSGCKSTCLFAAAVFKYFTIRGESFSTCCSTRMVRPSLMKFPVSTANASETRIPVAARRTYNACSRPALNPYRLVLEFHRSRDLNLDLVDQISKHIAGGQSPEKFLQYLDLADYSARRIAFAARGAAPFLQRTYPSGIRSVRYESFGYSGGLILHRVFLFFTRGIKGTEVQSLSWQQILRREDGRKSKRQFRK